MTKKKILLIVLPIVAVVVIGIVIFCVLYFSTDMFKSTKELFWSFMAQNQDITNILENNQLSVQEEFKESNSYNSTGTLTVSHSQGGSETFFNIDTTARHDLTTGRTYADATLKNGDIDLVTVSYIKSEDIYAIRSGDVLDYYIGIRNSNLKELAAKYNISTDIIPDTFELDDYTSFFDMTDEQKTHIYETYMPILASYISEDGYTKTNQDILVDGVTYNANVYAASLTGEQVKQIMLDSLTKLKSDNETLVLISNKASILKMGVEYTDITNLTIRINELIEQINQITISGNMNIYVYENYDQTIRTVVELENVFEITYDRVNNKQILTIDYVQESIEEMIVSTQNTLTDTSEDITTDNTLNVDTNGETTVSMDSMADIVIDMNDVVAPTSDDNTLNTTTETDLNSLNENITDTSGDTTTDTYGTVESDGISRIVITKETSDQGTNNNITYTENINSSASLTMDLTYNMSAVTGNMIDNNYNLTISETTEAGISETLTIDYVTSTIAADQVEEIPELNDSNTVIANNYDADSFVAFATQWINGLQNLLTEKFAVLGIGLNVSSITAEDEVSDVSDVSSDSQ